MTVKDVLNLVVEYIGDTDLKNTTILGGAEVASEQQLEKLQMLLTCTNDVCQSIASMYFPLKIKEKISNSNGKFMFSNLKYPVLDVLKITDLNQNNVDFSMFPQYFEAKAGDLEITYNYLPKYYNDFDENLEVVENKVSKRLVAMGVVSRYFLISGMYADANAWENMFERAILVSSRKKTPVTIKKRRWV